MISKNIIEVDINLSPFSIEVEGLVQGVAKKKYLLFKFIWQLGTPKRKENFKINLIMFSFV